MTQCPNQWQGKPLVFEWPYIDPNGAVIGIVARYQKPNETKKDIVPFFKKAGQNWKAGIDLNPRPLFGLDRLAKQPKDKAVFIVEGEKCAAALHCLDVCAVSSLGGSQAAKKADWNPLNGFKQVFILPDNDQPGEHYAAEVIAKLAKLEHPPKVKKIALTGLLPGGDVIDWLKTFLSDWDGYGPIPTEFHAALKEELKTELQTAMPTPEEMPEPPPEQPHQSPPPQGAYPWQPAERIEATRPDVQPMTAELMPEPFRDWLTDAAHRMQTPADFSTVSAIVIVSSVIGAGCGIRPKQQDSWEVIPNLWGACIGRPSVVLKTPSMKEPLGLLERLQHVYGEIFEREKTENEFETLSNSAVLKDLKSRLDAAAKGKGKGGLIDKDEMAALKHEYMSLAENTEPEPARRLFKTNETTIQSMTLLQNQNPRGLLVFRDELTGLMARWDREDSADERAYFLEAWNGTCSYTDAKIGRGLTDAKNLCISLLGGIQPDRLARYLGQIQKAGNDGLIQRFQLAVWPDEPRNWQLIDQKPNTQARHNAFLILQKLAEMDFTEHGAEQGEHDDRPFFRFDQHGQAVFNGWITDLQTNRLINEENPLITEHFGKYRSLMPSLALIFHLIEVAAGNVSGPVTEAAALMSLRWLEYLESHARRIYAMNENPEQEAAAKLALKIEMKALNSPFTARDIYIKGWNGLKDKDTIAEALEILIDKHWLRMTTRPKPAAGGRTTTEYFINPEFL